MQVLLEWLANQVTVKATEDGFLLGLALQQGQHAPGDTHDREVERFVQVLLRAKRQNVAHCIQVLIILVAVFAVTWDVNSVDVAQLSQKLLSLLSVINWDDSSTTSLKEISVGCFKEALVFKL